MGMISYTKHGSSYLIGVSPDLIDEFRSVFRAARWSVTLKMWVLAATARVRAQLDNFIKSLALQSVSGGAA